MSVVMNALRRRLLAKRVKFLLQQIHEFTVGQAGLFQNGLDQWPWKITRVNWDGRNELSLRVPQPQVASALSIFKKSRALQCGDQLARRNGWETGHQSGAGF